MEATFITTTMTDEERQKLIDFQSRIDNTTGQLKEEPTVIQSADILDTLYFADMGNEEYHNSEECIFKYDNEGFELTAGIPINEVLSSGKLKECITPLHLKMYYESESKNSAALNNGSAFHSLILEPEKFEYRLFDDTKIVNELQAEGFTNARATKKYKEWFSQYQDESGNLAKDVLKKQAFQSMWRLKKKLAKDEVVQSLFKGAVCESSIFLLFDHKMKNGVKLTAKVRPDGLKWATARDAENFSSYGVKEGDLIIISVKTTIDASPSGFLTQCIRQGYNMTEAFYYDVASRWARETNVIKPANKVHTIFLTLEKDKEVLTGHYMLRPCTDEFLKWGRRDYRKNLDVFINADNQLEDGYESINYGSVVLEISAPGSFYEN